jgi:hypothetical protein
VNTTPSTGLAQTQASNNLILALRRPAFIALILGCSIALMASSRLSVELVLSTTLCWSYVPLAELVALLFVTANNKAELTKPQVIDRFFAGHTPWLLWIVISSLLPTFLPLTLTFTLMRYWLVGGALVALPWSLWIDFHFFRGILNESNSRTLRKLAVQRLVSWTLIIAVFSYGSLWPSVLGKVAL